LRRSRSAGFQFSAFQFSAFLYSLPPHFPLAPAAVVGYTLFQHFSFPLFSSTFPISAFQFSAFQHFSSAFPLTSPTSALPPAVNRAIFSAVRVSVETRIFYCRLPATWGKTIAMLKVA
jgi:hypothetical protein